tara:strand:+ start:60750 stop:61967 length:1218 start_codon:yes stop_codon:yes gene_type:complete
MAARGPHSLTNRQILDFCKGLYGQLSLVENIDRLRTEGLLRVSAEQREVGALQEQYIFDSEMPVLTEDNIHIIIGCLKKNLLEIKGIGEVDSLERDCLFSIVDNLNDDATEQAKTAQAFNSYIDSLASSRDRAKNEIAEIFYTLIRLGQLIATQAEANKMTMNNCAIVLGAKISDMLVINTPDSDPSVQMNRIENFNRVIGIVMGSNEYTKPFIEKYGEQECEARAAALKAAKKERRDARARELRLRDAYKGSRDDEKALLEQFQALTVDHRSIGPRKMSFQNLLVKKPESQEADARVDETLKALEIERARKMALRAVFRDSRQFRRLQAQRAMQAGASLGRLKMAALHAKATQEKRVASASDTDAAAGASFVVEVDLPGYSSDSSSSGNESEATRKPKRRPHKR